MKTIQNMHNYPYIKMSSEDLGIWDFKVNSLHLLIRDKYSTTTKTATYFITKKYLLCANNSVT